MTPAVAAVAALLAAAPAVREPFAPQPRAVRPLVVAPGTTAKLLLRGRRLDGLIAGAGVKPLGGAKTAGGGPDRLGPQEVEVEVVVPADAVGSVPVAVVGPAGRSKPLTLAVADKTPRFPEAEPNDGFAAAHRVGLPCVVEGVVGKPKDVDVVRLAGKQGQVLVASVHAARHGSPLDATLTLFDGDRRVVAQSDDAGGSSDPAVRAILPLDGAYFLAVADAHDSGGPWHAYRLVVR